VLAISGDLFDKNVDAENLRPKIREVFSGNPFDIVVIPGNHDYSCYKDMYFGENVTVLTELDQTYDSNEVRICGIPFQPSQGAHVIDKIRFLAGKLHPEKHNIVLYHGELLDAFFSRTDFGDEGFERYAPVKLSYFQGLNISYVLAGHFHTTFDLREFQENSYFVYPGSPISITKRELGQRKVNIFEIGRPPKEYFLDTPHFDRIEIALDPFEDTNPVSFIEQRLEKIHPQATVTLRLSGYLNSKKSGLKEEELMEKVRQVTTGRNVQLVAEFRDIQAILEDDLFQSFIGRLESADFEERTKRQMRDIAIKGMIKAKS
ncbi:MAG: DNA repair exonuclease, partial [Candidatus Bathyarchaeota archaeon]